MSMSCVCWTPEECQKEMPNALLLDVRTPGEYRAVHVEGAVLRPLGSLDAGEIGDLAKGKSACVLVCRAGTRARQAARELEGKGLPKLVVLEGGMLAWEKAGLPVVKGEPFLPLDRQVRVVIGSLVVLGALLAHFVDPSWIWLSAFLGAGLVFAGLTDLCPMANAIAALPWNKGAGKNASCSVS